MLNKVTLELEIPSGIDEDTTSILQTQTEFLVRFWKGVLNKYKEDGVAVPTLSMRSTVKKTVKNNESKEFAKLLIEHHLQFQPKADVGNQMQSIKALYETGRTAEECINLYNSSKAEYPLTTWHTVKYKLSKEAPKQEEEMQRVELTQEQKDAIKNRIKAQQGEQNAKSY